MDFNFFLIAWQKKHKSIREFHKNEIKIKRLKNYEADSKKEFFPSIISQFTRSLWPDIWSDIWYIPIFLIEKKADLRDIINC